MCSALHVTDVGPESPVTYYDHRIYVAEGLEGGVDTKYYYCYDDLGNLLWKHGEVIDLFQPHDHLGQVIGKYLPSEPKLYDMDGVLFEDKYAIAVKKGNTELVTEINKVIDKLQADGKIDEFIQNHTSASASASSDTTTTN